MPPTKRKPAAKPKRQGGCRSDSRIVSLETLNQRHGDSFRFRGNNSTQSYGFQRPIRALLSIRPPFTSAILRGDKRFEFRKTIFSSDVEIVVVYATVPVGRVVAEFDVTRVIVASPEELWRITKEFAGITRSEFRRYFRGKALGYAIEIGEVRRYRRPFCPVQSLGVRPPQSFRYLDHSTRLRAATADVFRLSRRARSA